MPILNWIKRNKLATILLLILGFFLLKNIVFYLFPPRYQAADYYGGVSNFSVPSMGLSKDSGFALPGIMPPVYREAAPAPEVKNRMVVQESSLSLLVKDVRQALTSVKGKIESLGGYIVESNLSSPEQSPSGQIILRVPQEKLDEALIFLRAQAVKVVSENLSGSDVTDQFVDNEARLKILNANKARFEEIMAKAVTVEDILRVQQEIFNLQTQIDAIVGQQNYLTKTAQTSRITVYLSTDELALPYAPSDSWRPEVILKNAVRSLLKTLQNLGTLIIWLAVYGVVWVPVLLVAFLIYRRFAKPRTP